MRINVVRAGGCLPIFPSHPWVSNFQQHFTFKNPQDPWLRSLFPISPNIVTMAEAVALGASVVAFIQLADRVITMSKNLIDSGADMPTTLRMAHTEALSLRDILKELKQRQSMSSIPEVEASTVLLNATKKPADKCHASMEQLEVELSKLSISPSHSQISPSKRQRIKQTVKWAAGGEERVKKLLTTLMTEKLTLSLALVAEMS